MNLNHRRKCINVCISNGIEWNSGVIYLTVVSERVPAITLACTICILLLSAPWAFLSLQIACIGACVGCSNVHVSIRSFCVCFIVHCQTVGSFIFSALYSSCSLWSVTFCLALLLQFSALFCGYLQFCYCVCSHSTAIDPSTVLRTNALFSTP